MALSMTTAPTGTVISAAGPARSGTGAVRVAGLVKSYGGQPVLRDLDLFIGPGEFVALLGASGSGKTTLLRVLAALEAPTGGHVRAPGNLAVVFQEHRLLPWRRVVDNVALGLPRAAGRTRAAEVLAEVGLAGRERSWPRELSGGQAQRVALARALVHQPDLLLLDEPFGALDALTRLRMHALIRELWARHSPTTLFVTHDVDEALTLADRLVVLSDGRIGLDLPIDLPRPRQRAGDHLAALRTEVLAQLGVVEVT